MNRTGLVRAACAALFVAVAWPTASMAQSWPSRPITVIIPNEAGGGIDTIARAIQPGMEKALGERLVFVNKGGAAGAIGAEMVARAEPNGYTVMLTANAPLEVIPVLRKSGYDPIKDFKPIGVIASFPSFFAVPASLGVSTMQEFIALAKSRPGQLNYGSVGLGSTSNLNTEQLLLAAGIKATHVPYKGGGQVQQALLANEVQFTITTGSNVLPHLQSGALRLLAISSADLKSVAPPGTPAISDAIPGLQWKGWYALFAPAATPPKVLEKFRTALAQAIAQPETKALLMQMGTVPGSGEDLMALTREGLARTRHVVASTHMKLE
jgi:tripartite-type tricarboxylate transporter receptor subunit TctC